MLKKMIRAAREPKRIINHMAYKGFFDKLSDEKYIKLMFTTKLVYYPNLKQPSTYNEKIQWLKLNDRKEEYINLVDKYEVREYIKNLIGEEYLIPLIGVWESVDEIPFDKLPKQFVLKGTHNSGGVIVCSDKERLDIEKTKQSLYKTLKRNYYYQGREWPYKFIKPRIICEKYMGESDGRVPEDYKIICFNGEPQNIMVCTGRETGNVKYYFFDFDWNFLPYNRVDVNTPKDFTLPKPKNLEKMKELAEILSKPYDLSRIDLYEIEGKIYFGEVTLYPASGIDIDITKEIDKQWGSKINLKELGTYNENVKL